MPTYGLEIRYNNRESVHCYSGERGGVSAHLFMTNRCQMQLDVSLKTIGRRTTYSLVRLVPGDMLTFRFLRRAKAGRQSMAKLRHFKRRPITWRNRPRFRLGLDFRLKTGETVRASHPKQGNFRLMLGNTPFNYARVFVMASNAREKWHWQLPDLNPSEEVCCHIVETDWCDEPPTIKSNDEKAA